MPTFLAVDNKLVMANSLELSRLVIMCNGNVVSDVKFCSNIGCFSIIYDLASPTNEAKKKNANIVPIVIPRAKMVVNQNFPFLHLSQHLSGWAP